MLIVLHAYRSRKLVSAVRQWFQLTHFVILKQAPQNAGRARSHFNTWEVMWDVAGKSFLQLASTYKLEKLTPSQVKAVKDGEEGDMVETSISNA